MQTLLSLPREIRDQIIDHVVFFSKAPPQDPAHDTESRQDATQQGVLRAPSVTSRTYNAFGLLGTNMQLRSETQSRLIQTKLKYSLDVMVVDNELWPTWTCCPSAGAASIGYVNVSLRFFSKSNDPYVVRVARMCWAILQGRKWTNTSLHPLAELFMHIHQVCFQSDPKDTKFIRTLCFDAATAECFDSIASPTAEGPMSSVGLKSLFGKHRSLWNSFRSIHQYPFAGIGEARRLGIVASLKVMVLLLLQEAWEDECATYTGYVGPIGSAFRSVQNLRFAVDEQDLGQLSSSVLSI